MAENAAVRDAPANDSPALGNQNDASQTPPKKKQKRNKPTLSCVECVERKTKVRLHCSVHPLFARRTQNFTAEHRRANPALVSATAGGLNVLPASSDNPSASTRMSLILSHPMPSTSPIYGLVCVVAKRSIATAPRVIRDDRESRANRLLATRRVQCLFR